MGSRLEQVRDRPLCSRRLSYVSASRQWDDLHDIIAMLWLGMNLEQLNLLMQVCGKHDWRRSRQESAMHSRFPILVVSAERVVRLSRAKQTVRPASDALTEMEIPRLPDGSNQSQPRALRMAVEKARLWPNGQSLLVKFFDGSADLHKKVKKVAQTWQKYAHIEFKFVDNGPSDIRISFDERGGCFSVVGTEARKVPDDKATMNLATANMTSRIVERCILHELGHALGCIHEHCSPTANIRWNTEHVYSHFERLGWNKDMVKENLFQEYTPEATEYSPFDSMSIMMYPLESAWTKDGYTARYSWDLSETDKEFISRVYPKP